MILEVRKENKHFVFKDDDGNRVWDFVVDSETVTITMEKGPSPKICVLPSYSNVIKILPVYDQ